MIEKLKEISYLNIQKDKEKYELIIKILNDPDCFKIMKIETAYSILSDLGFKSEEIKEVYNEIMFETL